MKHNTKQRRSKWIKGSIAVLLMCGIIFLYFQNHTMELEAVWSEIEETYGDSDKYEVLSVSSRKDSTALSDPTFTITDHTFSTSTDNVHMNGAIIEGIGRCSTGDKFTIKASGSAQFKGENMSYQSSDTTVASVQADRNGNCVVTVRGPGVVSISWTYVYQRYCEEETTETSQSGTTDADGNVVTSTVTTRHHYLEQSTISGELTGNINPQIETNPVYMQPGDTIYLKTNVPSNNSNFYAVYNQESSDYVRSCQAIQRNGYWWIMLTAKEGNLEGVIRVTAQLNYTSSSILNSDPVNVSVTSKFGLTPTYTEFNCVSYTQKNNGTLDVTDHYETITVDSSSDENIEWVYIDSNKNETPIEAGSDGVEVEDGLNITINGKSVVVHTSSALFDNVDDSVSSITFKIRATQVMEGETFSSESNIVVTRPVSGVEIRRDGTQYLINSQQELYEEIAYTTNGNGQSINQRNFEAETDVLTAWLAGMGDDYGGVYSIEGTNGEVVDTYNYSHTPYNSTVRWTSTDTNVIQIQSVSDGVGISTCVVVAAGAGRATVQAVTEDGSFVASVDYIVRPYPKTVYMDETYITERLGDLTSKQLSLVAHVTSGDKDENPADDEYLDDGIAWEINSGSDIGSITQDGVLTFTGPGTIVVRAVSTVEPELHKNFREFKPWAVCTILIEQPVESITITNKPTDPIMTGEILALRTKIEPTNATDQSVVWTSANESIATVDAEGKVTAVGPGSTTIRVQTNSGAKYDTCTIDVRRLATGITLNRSEAIVSRGNKLQLFATVIPDDTTDKTVTWTSSDKSVATVSNKGVVTGVKVSKDPVIITATTSNGISAECYVTVSEPVTGIKISPTKKTIYVGKTFTIKSTVYPLGNDSVNKNVTWKSSNKSVATVDQDGKVTPKAGGTCTITCTTEDGGFIAKCKVTVKEKVSSILLNKNKLTMTVGSKFQLRANVLNKTATNRAITWSSSKPSIVSVSEDGKLTAKKTGTAKITVMAKDGSKVKAVCKVTVVRKCTSLKLNKSYITLITGYQYRTLKATVRPKSATNRQLRFTSSNPAVVSVNKRTGTMFAESAGTAFITVRTTDGSKLTKRCRVKVIDPVPIESLTISQSEITLKQGQKSNLEVRTIPTNTTSAVLWMTDDESIATVSSTGVVTAKGAGTTTITAYCNDGVESQCQVTVIRMNPSSIAIEQYDQYTLAVDGAGSGTITWNSSNSNIVTVTNGQIQGVKPGTAVVSATYNGKKVNCTVTVKNIP